MSKINKIAYDFWHKIPQHFNNCYLDEFIVMPNHLHGIIYINYNNEKEHKIVRNAYMRSLQNTKMMVPRVIQTYKAAVTRETTKLLAKNMVVWHKSYYDRVIRCEKELNNIREYIANNPLNWQNDQNNPINLKQKNRNF